MPLRNAGRRRAGARGRARRPSQPRTRADAQAALLRASATRFAGRGQPTQRHDPRAAPVPRPPRAGDAQPVRARDSELRNLVPGAGAAAARGGAGGRGAGAAVRPTWPTPSPRSAATRAALQETIEETPPTLAAATASFRVQTPFLARFADVSRRLQPGRRRAAPRAAADQRRAQRGRARLPPHARAERATRAAVRGARATCLRTRTRCWRCATCAARCRSAARRSSTSRPTRRSATTSSTSSTRSARTCRRPCRAARSERILAKLADLTPAEHARHDRVDAAGGRARRPGPAVRRAPGAAHPVRRPGGRRAAAAPTARAARPAT